MQLTALTVMFLITALPTALAFRCESGGTHNAGGDCHGNTNDRACQTSNDKAIVSTLFCPSPLVSLFGVFFRLLMVSSSLPAIPTANGRY